MNEALKLDYINWIRKAKSWRKTEENKLGESFVNYFIDEQSKDFKSKYTYEEINLIPEGISGVYLIFSKKNNKVIFTYVGQSKDIKKRLINHTKKLEKSFMLNKTVKKSQRYMFLKMANNNIEINDLNFIILDICEDEQVRFKTELYYIHTLRIKPFSLNISMNNRSIRCPNLHGMGRTKSRIIPIEGKYSMELLHKCIRKDCIYSKWYML